MNVLYHLQGIDFEWDGNKARTNRQKHGVTFEEAAEVFFDPFYQQGDAFEQGEQRDFVLGYSFSQHLRLVIYTERGQRTRLISARPATRAEKKFYEEA